jgi:hypothetical protein
MLKGVWVRRQLREKYGATPSGWSGGAAISTVDLEEEEEAIGSASEPNKRSNKSEPGRSRVEEPVGDVDLSKPTICSANREVNRSSLGKNNPNVNKTKKQEARSNEPHVHSFPDHLQRYDEESGVTHKECPCGFTLEVEEL